ncbi:MAG: alkaline phosphatase family protein [Melioribacteraceae bacterium]|nr:alkaline phosphatase family protein [Melioribacteraceae bacterium]MCF8353407.1 alkaline phosphatase family protein [Melioribacteraceae bacterium]MCF8396374.1 alkaline phosphatase family protein [Melioribacteraceae bacterium]MCF8418968.1 alkaline phosphatase family protein [Melioribacteraceae bacterium]
MYGAKMLQNFFFISVLFFLVNTANFGQVELLQSGPMVGYSTMREVCLWVQTTEPADVQIEYWEQSNPDKKYFTDSYQTIKEEAYTAKLFADSVEPGKKYFYQLWINDSKINISYNLEFQTQKLWQWREEPPEFSFVAGSCAYVNEEIYDRPGTPYGGQYQIFENILLQDPDFMIWLGDNTYLREADWNSWTGIVERYTHTRSLPELQPLLGSVHHYAIWDDHDFGPNNADRSWWGKEKTLKAFKLFWSNPTFGVNGQPGITNYFEWGDAAFFMLDNRYFKSPNYREFNKREMLGDEQIQWLIDELVSSRAPFKFVCIGGQFLSPVPEGENHITYPEERVKILKSIDQEGIEGVIFLSGDRHFTELSKMERHGTYPLYDFTISPLTAGPNKREPEPNFYRVEGTHFTERNFAKFEITGARKNRQLECTIYDSNGKEIWKYKINENDLKD